MNPKVKDTLNKIIDRFQSGDIPKAVAYSMFPFPEVPSAKWSLTNRTLMFLSGTMDARGIRQWNAVNRRVNRGTKAFYILVPYMKHIEDDLGEQRHKLMGFGVCPVFRVEDTDGEPLEYENIKVPDFPLIDRAKQFGVSVKAVPGNFNYFGYYAPGQKVIAVATAAESVFFHELSHAAHHILNCGILTGQDPIQEIVAELSAQALALICGKTAEDFSGNGYRYIERYSRKAGLTVPTACLKVLAETEKVLNLVLTGKADKSDEYREAA